MVGPLGLSREESAKGMVPVSAIAGLTSTERGSGYLDCNLTGRLGGEMYH